MSRPRLNVAALAPTTTDAERVQPPAADPTPSPSTPTAPSATTWVRPTPSIELPVPAPQTRLAGADIRRSPAKKANRSVSVPLHLGERVRARAAQDGWSITDVVFEAVERYRDRLRAAPEIPGRPVGPKPASEGRALLVLYLADTEWENWKHTAQTCGLRSTSRLVADAIKAM